MHACVRDIQENNTDSEKQYQSACQRHISSSHQCKSEKKRHTVLFICKTQLCTYVYYKLIQCRQACLYTSRSSNPSSGESGSTKSHLSATMLITESVFHEMYKICKSEELNIFSLQHKLMNTY